MRYRQLGNSGLTVSVVGLGCNNFGGRIGMDASRQVIDAAIDHGISLFDTADTYGDRGGSEEIIGRVLGQRRDEVVLATKFGHDMGRGDKEARGGRRYVRMAVEASLRRLRTDHIDLYQLHSPDPRTPITETLAALDELVAEGKVRYLGCSNFAAWQVADADWEARAGGFERFVSAQNEYSLLERGAEVELLAACRRFGVGVLPYFPLARGLLTGKYRRGEAMPAGTRLSGQEIDEVTFDRIEALDGFAKERGHTLLDFAFAGLLAHREVSSVIAGATRPEQVAANVTAGEWELDELP